MGETTCAESFLKQLGGVINATVEWVYLHLGGVNCIANDYDPIVLPHC